MMLLILLVIVILILLTVVLARKARKSTKEVRVSVVTAIIGAIVTLTFAGGGILWYALQAYKHDTCVTRAEGRNSTRVYDFTLNRVIDAVAGTSRYTTATVAPGLPTLESVVPAALDPTKCTKHP